MELLRAMLLISVLVFHSVNGYGQTILNQKGSQIKSLIKQIGLLKVYISALKKGYEIAKTGLKTISDIKNGDFLQHLKNFNSLKEVKPGIKKYSSIVGIIGMQVKINQTISVIEKISNKEELINPEEKAYIKTVHKYLLKECDKNLNELIRLINSGNYALKDDERLQRIEGIYNDMQDKLQFAASFGQEIKTLLIQRYQTFKETDKTKQLYGIK